MTKILIIGIVAFALLGFLIGYIKGYTKVKNWAFEYAMATICAILVSKFLSSYSNKLQFILVFALAVVFFLFFAFLSYRAKKFFENGIKKRKLRSYYEQYRDRMENEEDICDAIEDGDEKEYKRCVNKKYKEKSGAVGIANRVVGGLALAVKGIVLFLTVAYIILIAYYFTHLEIPAISKYTNDFFAGSLWAFAKQFFLDFAIVAIMCACIKMGFEKGVITPLWSFIMLGLIGAGVFIAYNLAFNVEVFVDLAKSLQSTFGENLSKITEPISKYVSVFTALNVCKALVMLVMFLLLLVPIIFVGAFGPKLLKNARESVIFKTIEGVFGAVLFTALILAIILTIGAVLYTVNDLEFMARFNELFEDSSIAKFIYQNNELNEFKYIRELPIRDWLTAK